MHPRPRRTRVGVPRARDDDEIDRVDHVFPAVPGADLRKCIGSDHEEYFASHRFHPLDAADRVTLLAAGFETRCDETWLARAGQFHHFVAILVIRAGFLVGRITRIATKWWN